jgi:hypothetical protein
MAAEKSAQIARAEELAPVRWNDPEWEDSFRPRHDIAQGFATCAQPRGGPSSQSSHPAPDLPFQALLRSRRGGCICNNPVVLRTADQDTCNTCGAPIRFQIHTSLYNRCDEATDARRARVLRGIECDDERPEYPVVTIAPARPTGRCRVCVTRRMSTTWRYRSLAKGFLGIYKAACCKACENEVVRGGECVARSGGADARRSHAYQCRARKRDNVIFLYKRLLSMKQGLARKVENGRELPCVYAQTRGDCNELTHEAKQELLRLAERMGARPHTLRRLSKRNDALVCVNSAIECLKMEVDAIRAPVKRIRDIAKGNRHPETEDAAWKLKVCDGVHVQTPLEMLVECLRRKGVQVPLIKLLLSSPVSQQACALFMPYIRDLLEWMTSDGQRLARSERYCCSNDSCRLQMCLHMSGVVEEREHYDVRRFWQLQIKPLGMLAHFLCIEMPSFPTALMQPQSAHDFLLSESEDAFFRSRFFAYRSSHTATAAFVVARSDHFYEGSAQDVETRRSDLAHSVSVYSAAAVLGLWPQFFAPCFAPVDDVLALMHPRFGDVVDRQLTDFNLRAGSGSFDGVVVARLIVHARAGGDGVVRAEQGGVAFDVPCPPEHVMGGRNALQYIETVRAIFAAVRRRVGSAAMLPGEFRRVENTLSSLSETTRLLSTKVFGSAGQSLNTQQMEDAGFHKERLHPNDFAASENATELALQASQVGQRLSLAIPGLNHSFWPSVDAALIEQAMHLHPIAALFVPMSTALCSEGGHYARATLSNGPVAYDGNGQRVAQHIHANETVRRKAHDALHSSTNLQPVARQDGARGSVKPMRIENDQVVVGAAFPGRAALVQLSKGKGRKLATTCNPTPTQHDNNVARAVDCSAAEVSRMQGMIRFLVRERYRQVKNEKGLYAVAFLRDALRHNAVDDTHVGELFAEIVKCMVLLHTNKTTYPVVCVLLEQPYVTDFLCQLTLAHGLIDEKELASVIMAGQDFERNTHDSAMKILQRERPRCM